MRTVDFSYLEIGEWRRVRDVGWIICSWGMYLLKEKFTIVVG